MNESATRVALLDLAQDLAQTRGFNAFSYQDLAEGVGIRTASIHHHFPTKADLGREIMARYRERFRGCLEKIESETASGRGRLEEFAELFRITLRKGNRLCLCGMLATEYATLPAPMQREVKRFYEETETWLAHVVQEGRAAKHFSYDGPSAPLGRAYFAALEGAMIAARTFNDESRLSRAAQWFLSSLEPHPVAVLQRARVATSTARIIRRRSRVPKRRKP
ncbi:MAG TPA: TetR/AcrR family transcriptional regulator [bacterium]|nr:TetR/AcrR family transcriptional regulator [bacterium]